MQSLDFQELVNESKEWVSLSKKRGYDFDSILAGLYNDPSHFIYEILQNAEDEGATQVTFRLHEDRLDIFHDGEDFDFKDIVGVTGIGISTKKGDIDAIGKFGIGFKSVFAITQTPVIHSGEYHIKIEDFVIPSVIENGEQVNGTKITLPFNHKFRLKKEIFELVKNKLEDIGLKSLLFLRNIDEVKWNTPYNSGHYLKSSNTIKEVQNARRVTIIAQTREKVDSEEYLAIEKPLEIDNKVLKVEVAFKIGKDKGGKEIILHDADSKLVVFFPTEKVTFLNFLIQGPYKTTPNRENIPLDDEQNKLIIKETAKLVADSIPIIKELGYLDINFLNTLPLKRTHFNEPYLTIFDAVKAKLLSGEELLPTHDNKYAKASDALLARGRDLPEILCQADIEQLYSQKYWLDTNITEDRTPELRYYLISELKIAEIDFEDFARKVTSEFLESKNDEWMVDFYGRLLEQRGLWRDRKTHPYKEGALRTKPIIRLEDNSHMAPCDNEGNIQVYLPTESKSSYNTVKRALVENEYSLKFLKEFGLSQPDLFAEIREFILPKYQKDELVIAEDEYLEDFEKLLSALNTIPSDRKGEFISQLYNLKFIKAVNLISGESSLLKPSKVYFNTEDLRNYFDGFDMAYFISDVLYTRFAENKLIPFLKEIGVEDKPRRIEFDPNLTGEEKQLLRNKSYESRYTRENYQRDYDLEGLDHFIEQTLTKEKSALLWKLILENIKSLHTLDAKYFFKGKYSWFYRTDYSQYFGAKYFNMIQQKEWLIDKNGAHRRPSEVTFSELSDVYLKESPNIEILKEELKFKPDAFDQLPEEDQSKLEIVKGRSPEEVKEALALFDEKKGAKTGGKGELEDDWNPEHKPNDVNVIIETVTPEQIKSPDLKDQTTSSPKGGSNNNNEEPGKDGGGDEISKEEISGLLKKIGKWGEEFVFKGLKCLFETEGNIEDTEYGFSLINNQNEAIEVYQLNIKSDVGKGYDFVIKRKDEEVEYIEVKTKLHGEEELIEITGTQWEFARKLFDEGEGDKYWIYVVVNAGQSGAKVKRLQNPIKLWKSGRLYAHPVQFKL